MDEERKTENTEEKEHAKPVAVVRKVVQRGENITVVPGRTAVPRTTFVRRTTTQSADDHAGKTEENAPAADINDLYSSDSDIHTVKDGGTVSEAPRPSLECKYSRVVLIGMPCSGKTSIGRALAASFDYTFYDMDEYIETMAQKTIPEIFAQEDGEAKFRELETKAAKELGKTDKAIIATGGGAVTRDETIEHLRHEGSYVVFVHRSLYNLVTTPPHVMNKRPLFKNTSLEALIATYKFRLPLYRKYSDVEVENDKNREEAVEKIKKIIEK